MIKVKTSKGTTKFEFDGDVCELTADLMMIIQTVCENVAAKNPEHAEIIAHCITDELTSPAFWEELHQTQHPSWNG